MERPRRMTRPTANARFVVGSIKFSASRSAPYATWVCILLLIYINGSLMIGERLTGGTFGETEITRCGNSISLFFQQQRW